MSGGVKQGGVPHCCGFSSLISLWFKEAVSSCEKQDSRGCFDWIRLKVVSSDYENRARRWQPGLAVPACQTTLYITGGAVYGSALPRDFHEEDADVPLSMRGAPDLRGFCGANTSSGFLFLVEVVCVGGNQRRHRHWREAGDLLGRAPYQTRLRFRR